jgi:hypothetical protein
MMNSVIDLIHLIQKKPAMYLGKRSISCLKSFLDGWFLRNPEAVTDGETMSYFQEWIEKKYKVSTSHSWCDVILFYSLDESDALENFFQYFNEYLTHNSKQTKIIRRQSVR